MFKNVKVGINLWEVFVMVVILAAVASVGYINIKAIAARADVMYKQNTAAIEEMGAINASIQKMRGDVYRFLRVPAEQDQMAESINSIMNSVNEAMQRYKNRNITDEERKIIAEFDIAWPEMQRGYKEIIKLGAENRNDEVDRLMASGSYVFQASRAFAAISNLNDFNRKNAEAANKTNSKAVSMATAFLVIATVLAIALAVTLGLILTFSITRPLHKALIMIQEMSKGHLSERLDLNRTDEIGLMAKAMDLFAENLKEYVVKVCRTLKGQY